MIERTTATERARGEDFLVSLRGEKRTGSETTVLHASIRPDLPPIVGTLGSDCAGLLRCLARTFGTHRLNIAACHGTRLRFCQESAFEFADGAAEVRNLFTKLRGQDVRFTVPEPGRTAMKCELALDIRENRSGKLWEITEALADAKGVVIEEFEAREELFPNRVAGRPGHRFPPEASFFAKIDLSERVTPKMLEQTLRERLPHDEPTITVRRVLDPFPRTMFPIH